VRCCVETRSLWCQRGGRHGGTWSGSRQHCRCDLQRYRSSAYAKWSPPHPDRGLPYGWAHGFTRRVRRVRWVILPPSMQQYVSTSHVSPSSKVIVWWWHRLALGHFKGTLVSSINAADAHRSTRSPCRDAGKMDRTRLATLTRPRHVARAC
jgi:hypothetical protein